MPLEAENWSRISGEICQYVWVTYFVKEIFGEIIPGKTGFESGVMVFQFALYDLLSCDIEVKFVLEISRLSYFEEGNFCKLLSGNTGFKGDFILGIPYFVIVRITIRAIKIPDIMVDLRKRNLANISLATLQVSKMTSLFIIPSFILECITVFQQEYKKFQMKVY